MPPGTSSESRLSRRLLTPIVAPIVALGVAATTVLTGAAAPATAVTLPSVQAKQADSLADSYGVCVHMAYLDTPYGNLPQVTSAIRGLGVRHVRDDFFMATPWQWDPMRKLSASTGVKFDLIMGKPNSPQSAADFVNTAASQLPGIIDGVEGSNEWDISGDGNWVGNVRARQSALYAAAKANPATRSLPVLAPSMAFPWNQAALGNLSGMADLGNGHLYAGGRNPSYDLNNTVPALVASTGNRPTMVTETGYHNGMNANTGHPAVPENVAATYLPRTLLENYNRGVKRTYSYELVDEFVDPNLTNQEAHFGMMRRDWSPKPAYFAMQSLLGLVRDPGPAFVPGQLQYAVNGAGGDVRRTLVQRRDGSFVLLLWRDVSVYDQVAGRPVGVNPADVTVQLGSPSAVNVFRPSSQAGAVSTAAGTTSVPLSLDGQVTALWIAPAGIQPPEIIPGGTTQDYSNGSPQLPYGAGTAATVAGPKAPPAAPQVVRVRSRHHGVKVAWKAPGPRVTRYEVIAGHRHLRMSPRQVRAVVRGLRSRTTLRVGVRAANRSGWGKVGWSRPVRTR